MNETINSALQAATSPQQLPLFRKFPALGAKLPHVSLGIFPTPVEKVAQLGAAHAHPMEAWFELARDKRLKLMNPLMLEIPAQTELKREITRMDQFIYGIEGQVHVTLPHEEFMLTPGDSIYFNGHVAHGVANRAELMAKVLVIHATQATAHPAV